MRRVVLLALVMIAGGGCATGKNGSWDEVKKDLRGDNMKMMSDRTGSRDLSSQPSSMGNRMNSAEPLR